MLHTIPTCGRTNKSGRRSTLSVLGSLIPAGLSGCLLVGAGAAALAQSYPAQTGFQTGGETQVLQPVSVPITMAARSPDALALTVPPAVFREAVAVPIQSIPASVPVQVAQVEEPVTADTPIQAPEGAPPVEDDTDVLQAALSADAQGGILTRQGQFVIDQSVEYSRSSTERLVFRGVEIVPALLVGVIDASNVTQDAVAYTAGLRYGVTDNFELSLSIPYIYRNETSTILIVRQGETEITRTVEGQGLGDIQVGARYQLPRPSDAWPYLIAGLTVKSNTGTGPYDVDRDADGVAREPSLGSGFWGIRAGISAIMPVQPAVLYANLSYLHNIARNINKTIGGVRVGRVDPGDAISFGVGMGFSVTPDFSYSLGYNHDYIFPTSTQLGNTTQRSSDAHVGSLQFGLSYAVTDNIRPEMNFHFGVTEEAPDVRVMFSLPIRF